MPILNVGKKFPWKTALLGILVVILLLVLVGVLLPDVGTWMMGLVVGLSVLIVDVAIACFTNMFFWAGFGLMGIVFFVYFYRKNYAKKKVLVPSTTGALPVSDTLASGSLFDDQEVSSA